MGIGKLEIAQNGSTIGEVEEDKNIVKIHFAKK